MNQYYIFILNRYDPNAYHFIGSPTGDELYPACGEFSRKWLKFTAKTPQAAVDKFVDYEENEVSPLGECALVAIEVKHFHEIHYVPPVIEGEIVWEEIDECK